MGRNKANVWDQSEFILVFVLSVANTAEPDRAMLVNVSYPDLIYCRLVQVGLPSADIDRERFSILTSIL